jgi:hypothetical protein
LCQAKDVTTFLCWASEPEHDGKRERERRASGREKGEREREARGREREGEREIDEIGTRENERRERHKERERKLCLRTRRPVCAIMGLLCEQGLVSYRIIY